MRFTKIFAALSTVMLYFVFLPGIVVNATTGTDEINATTAKPEQSPKVNGGDVPEQFQPPFPSVQPPGSAALKGSVQGLHLLGQSMLSHIGSTTETMKKACLVILNELAMPQSVTGTAPNIIGSTVIPSLPFPSGVGYLGHEEPHLGAASAAVNALIEHARRLENEISTTVVPAETDEYTRELWDKVHEISEKLYADLNDLAALTRSQGAKYETTKMEKITLRIYDKSEALNKLRRRIAEELHKEK